jgi:hypothetical protein
MEHPALCSLREYLDAASQKDATAKPLTVTKLARGTQPTPCLIMNAPREVAIDAVGASIYGNNFSDAPTKKIEAATTLLHPVTHSNIIAMEALKHGRGAYTTNQICIILQTAVSAFVAAKAEAYQEYRDMQSFVANPTVVVHTGNWGCGAFGGNIELMCLLQMISARVAGIDRVVYHVLSADNEKSCAKAMFELDAILLKLNEAASNGSTYNVPALDSTATPTRLCLCRNLRSSVRVRCWCRCLCVSEAPDLDELASHIARKGYRWGFSNGT